MTAILSEDPCEPSSTSTVQDSIPGSQTASTTVPAHVIQGGEEQALESHEVIELQKFSERKAWIEEKIKVVITLAVCLLILYGHLIVPW